ncbi:MAG: phosphate uptake regulator PhoU [Candidatus Bathyarchaeota archaeon]|nr:MAG: phosphate uptake regulator PhoU [Candidatus Bathyarchaeota archaeon]
MELRKVQRTVSGTFFVSLPKEWAERVGLSKGTALAMSESIDGQLCLFTQHDEERTHLGVVLKPSPYLSREIVGKYLLGYDEIRVEAKGRISSEERALIKETSNRVIGLEIVEEDFASIVLQSLLGSASSPETILRREYNIASSMHRDAINAFLDGDFHLARNVIARDVETNRFYFLLVRTLRTLIQNPSLGEKWKIRSIDCLDYRLCASFVEAIGDRAGELACKTLALKDAEISREVSQLIGMFHSKVFESQEKALKAFFNRSVILAEEVKDVKVKIEAMLHEIESVVKKQPTEIVPIILAMASSIYRIFGHCVDIADLVMPREF